MVEYPVEAVVFKDAVTEIKNIGTKKSLGLAVIPSNYTEALEEMCIRDRLYYACIPYGRW